MKINKPLKVLNLYAGIGGNRKLWPSNVEVTAVEYESDIAQVYQEFFPQDHMVVDDAHQYLLDHYSEFDFIWASPPCPTHSKMGMLAMKYMEKVRETKEQNRGGVKELAFPDMKLYEEIIFLKYFFKGKWVVENTISYYDPLIPPFVSGSHYFWSNFHISNYKLCDSRAVSVATIKEKQAKTGFNLKGFSFKNIDSTHKKDKVLNNCVDSKLGLYVFNCAFKETQELLYDNYTGA